MKINENKGKFDLYTPYLARITNTLIIIVPKIMIKSEVMFVFILFSDYRVN